MKLALINDKEYQKRFEEIKSLQLFCLDNDLKVKYSEKLLEIVGDTFDVFPPGKKSNKMKSGSCYTNSIKKMEKGFTYVEGVITHKSTGQKISHAWNIDSNGKHVDFTILKTDDYFYKGIIIPKKILYEVGFKNGGIWYCCLPYLEITL